jgi:hypothetical protein
MSGWENRRNSSQMLHLLTVLLIIYFKFMAFVYQQLNVTYAYCSACYFFKIHGHLVTAPKRNTCLLFYIVIYFKFLAIWLPAAKCNTCLLFYIIIYFKFMAIWLVAAKCNTSLLFFLLFILNSWPFGY